MTDRGVVTLADSHYFQGLLGLHRSIRTSWPCPIACFDIGLTEAQRRIAAEQDELLILDLPSDPLIAELEHATRDVAPLGKREKRIWPLWICPLLIWKAPFKDVFWIDCDILVLRGLDELFAMLEAGPVFTPENKAPERTPNRPELYELLPIERDFDPRRPVVNAGVSGWRKTRDAAALAAYLSVVAAAARSRAVMNAISWHDQGALIWAIQRLGLEHRVLDSDLWNLCVDRAGLPARHLRWDRELCDRLRARLPDVRLLHWNGRPTPWSR
jgi:hypothetical protein